jgi:hypothetical protein
MIDIIPMAKQRSVILVTDVTRERRNKSGSLPIFTAIRRASSRVSCRVSASPDNYHSDCDADHKIHTIFDADHRNSLFARHVSAITFFA